MNHFKSIYQLINEQQLNEYYVKSISDLKKYLTMSDDEKYKDVVSKFANYTNPNIPKQHANTLMYYYIRGFKDYSYDGDLSDDDKISLTNNPSEYEKIFSKKDYKDFYDFIMNNDLGMNLMIRDLPSWSYMEFNSIVKNQWLIHFSDHSNNIYKEQKFKYGVDDLSKLGLTTHQPSYTKEKGGYNFAFDLNDYLTYGGNQKNGWKYGDSAVIFRASGIKVNHLTDKEPQVIFQGDTATNINKIVQNKNPIDRFWFILNKNTEKPLIKFEKIEQLVNWFINNYDQYRKNLY